MGQQYHTQGPYRRSCTGPIPTKAFIYKKRDTKVTNADSLTGTQPQIPLWEENKSLELKCQDWKSWAYTDGSRQKKENEGKTTQYIGAGVYHPNSKSECYVHS